DYYCCSYTTSNTWVF
nr:immunoglobulin light chain junction region [Macaca mulatta]MOV95408.1 immunoglobulin light chain junction region [Macaca mulatta]MOV99662.1 immunoglobulin light chain junction region [Macaca mulatta]MOW00273.1 immunoglobulin light chain junction region [Macaca mulatta]MOW27282.1 immunoglobulin light chain junction region [Macaca mulatta]